MNKPFTNRQIALLLYSSIFAYGIIELPKDIAEIANTGSWFPVFIATIIFSFMTYIITYLQYVFQDKTLYEYSQQLVGKLITNIITVIIIIYFFILFTMIVRAYSEMIKLIFLFKTPVTAICILFYIVVGYALLKGINTIARLCEIYCLINIIGFISIILLLATKGKLINIQPLFLSDDFTQYLKALSRSILSFSGIEILYLLPINRKENKNIFKYNTFIVGLVGIMYIFILEVCISVVGVETLIYYKFPLFSIIKGVDIYYLEFFRRLDGICIFYWSLNVISSICIRGYGVLTFTQKITKNIKYQYIIIIITILALIVTKLPKTGEQVSLILKYNSYLGVVIVIILPAILFVITRVKKYDKQI